VSVDSIVPAQLAMGCAHLGEATSGVSWSKNVAMVRTAVEGGIDAFDTADAYMNGTSERLLGRALRGQPNATIFTKAGYLFRPRSALEARARFLAGPIVRRLGGGAVAAVTKGEDKFVRQDFSPEYLTKAVTSSLRRLGVGRIDLLQLHAPRAVDPDPVLEWARNEVDGGRIARLGVAVEDVAEAMAWVGRRGIDSVQLPFSVFDAATALPIIDRARASGTAVIARGVLGGGRLDRSNDEAARRMTAALDELAAQCGRSRRDLAVGFARSQPGVDVVVVGLRLPHHVTDLVALARRGPLGHDEVAAVRAIVHDQRP